MFMVIKNGSWNEEVWNVVLYDWLSVRVGFLLSVLQRQCQIYSHCCLDPLFGGLYEKTRSQTSIKKVKRNGCAISHDRWLQFLQVLLVEYGGSDWWLCSSPSLPLIACFITLISVMAHDIGVILNSGDGYEQLTFLSTKGVVSVAHLKARMSSLPASAALGWQILLISPWNLLTN